MPSSFVTPLGLHVPYGDSGRAQAMSFSTRGREGWINCEGLEDTHNGVRNDDAVEVRELEAQEQQDHQQGMGGCYK